MEQAMPPPDAAMKAQLPRPCCGQSRQGLSLSSAKDELSGYKICYPMHASYVQGAARTQRCCSICTALQGLLTS